MNSKERAADNELAQVQLTPPELEKEEAQEANGEYVFGKRVKRTYTYDATYGPEFNNQQIYDMSFLPLVKEITQGYNCTVFCYGQSGSGKSFTYRGEENKKSAVTENNIGIVQNAFNTLFDFIATNTDRQYMVKCSNIEIYQEEVRDLIDTKRQNLKVRETKQKGVYVDGLSEYIVKNTDDCLKYLDLAQSHRATASTGLNDVSSRSHCIFMLRFEQMIPDASSKTGFKNIYAMLNLTDLAGSERLGKTKATGQTMQEGCAINRSLFTLGAVIQSLADQKDFIPYRESVLTRLLQTSLGGNSKTILCALLNPCSSNYDETVSTCMFANNAKRIINKAKINEDPKDSMIREMQEKIKQLELKIQEAMLQKNLSPQQLQAMKNMLSAMKGETIVEEEVIEVEDEEEAKKRDEIENKKKQVNEALKQKQSSKAETERLLLEMKQQLGDMQGVMIDPKKVESELEKQQREIRESRQKLAEKQEKEKERLRKIEEQKDKLRKQEQQRLSIEDQIKAIKQQIEECKQQCSEVAQDMQVLQDQQDEQILGINKEYDQLSQKMLLKQMIIDNFIPKYEVQRAKDIMQFDEQSQKLKPASKESLEKLLINSRQCQVIFQFNNGVQTQQTSQEQNQSQQQQVKQSRHRSRTQTSKSQYDNQDGVIAEGGDRMTTRKSRRRPPFHGEK